MHYPPDLIFPVSLARNVAIVAYIVYVGNALVQLWMQRSRWKLIPTNSVFSQAYPRQPARWQWLRLRLPSVLHPSLNELFYELLSGVHSGVLAVRIQR